MYEVNLLPSELQSKPGFLSRRRRLAVFLMVLSLLLLCAYGMFLFQYNTLKQKTAEHNDILQEKSLILRNIKQKQEGETGVEKTLNNLLNNRITWSGLLLDVDVIQSPGLIFTEIKMYQKFINQPEEELPEPVNDEAGKLSQKSDLIIEIWGLADSTYAISDLYKELCELSYLQKVKLKSVEQIVNSKKMKFCITAHLLKDNNYVP